MQPKLACWLATALIFSSSCVSIAVPEPLLLTPLLKSGRYLEAQHKSLVPSLLPGLLNSGHSGFMTVDEETNTNLHFWFHPRDNTPNWKDYPIVLWLNGGTALSALRGAFQENMSAYNFTPDGKIKKSDYGLTHYVNVLLIDSTNVGFSHTSDPNYVLDDIDTLTNEYYNVLLQFFLLFPDLPRRIYIGGCSLGDRKIAALGVKILSGDRTLLDVSGVIVGDGVVDIETDFNFVDYYYNFGFLEKKTARNISNLQEKLQAFVREGEKDPADVRDAIFDENINTVTGVKGFDLMHIMNLFRYKDFWLDYIEREDVRSKLHVGRLKYTLEVQPSNLHRLKSNRPNFEKILNAKVPILRYTGQYDGILPYPSTVHTLRSLNWRGQLCLETRQFDRKQVWVSGTLVGYLRHCTYLWEVLLLSSSHVAQLDFPKALWTVVNFFIMETKYVT